MSKKKNATFIASSSDNILKHRLSIYLLLLLAFWNILDNIVMASLNYFAQVPEPTNYYMPLFSMIFISFSSILAYIFYNKRRKLSNLLHIKLSGETVIVTFYFIIIVFLSFFPKNWNEDLQSKNQENLSNYITLLILNNILFILMKNQKIKVLLVLLFSGICLKSLIYSSYFQNQIEIIKLLLQFFSNLSLVIFILYYEQAHKILSKTSSILTEKGIETKNEVKSNKVLFKFLNSLNSGILLYDQNLELLFLNKKMKKFCNQTSEIKSKCINITEDFKSDEEKNMYSLIRQKLYKLKNIKCFIPEGKEMNQSQVINYFYYDVFFEE